VVESGVVFVGPVSEEAVESVLSVDVEAGTADAGYVVVSPVFVSYNILY
jgi:hypothetical protein